MGGEIVIDDEILLRPVRLTDGPEFYVWLNANRPYLAR
jgi:hypothetical protein